MRKYLIGFAVGLVILGAIAFTCRQLFEVYDTPDWVPPSREAKINPYLALDRWLTETEHPVRLADSGDYETLEAAGEGTIFIQASLFDWSSEAAGFLFSWVEGGGILVLSLDWFFEEEGLSEFLAGLGISAADSSEDRSYHYHDSEPRLDRDLVFEVQSENSNILVMEDSGGFIRLVQILRGKGKVTVTGDCRFMSNYYLKDPPNARLAWNLLAEASGAGDPGVFFIRDFRERRNETSFLGRLFERGNFLAPLFSALLLIVVGFWSVLSVFGVVQGDNERPAKSLRERFLAEGRFLKRFGALDSYRAAYQKEIKKKLLRQEGLESEEEIILRAAALRKEAGGEDNLKAVKRAFSQSPLGYGDFRKTIIILKSILERL
jgi:hypothetical protein